MQKNIQKSDITEFHLFAGIGGGIYGGELLRHRCVGGVEIDKYCQAVLRQRQKDGWMDIFDIYDDITKLNGEDFKGKFDILCGGFPCQAFSHAARGKNIAEKDLWGEMLRFIQEGEFPVIFGENVTEKALNIAKSDLQKLSYIVYRCRLSCDELGADHRRNRFWLLAIKGENASYQKLIRFTHNLPKLKADCWKASPFDIEYKNTENDRRKQLKGVGNAQSPFAAAVAFRILLNRHINAFPNDNVIASEEEISEVFVGQRTWLKENKPDLPGGLVHTPTTMANYSCPSMMKHQGCRNYRDIFGRPEPKDAEYLMGLPIGASSLLPQGKKQFVSWIKES